MRRGQMPRVAELMLGRLAAFLGSKQDGLRSSRAAEMVWRVEL